MKTNIKMPLAGRLTLHVDSFDGLAVLNVFWRVRRLIVSADSFNFLKKTAKPRYSNSTIENKNRISTTGCTVKMAFV